MKIALCQFEIQYEQKEANLIRAESFIKEAALKGASFILFPEMSFTGFSMNTLLTGEEDFETVKKMKQLAVKYHIAIGFGWVNKKAQSENHYTVINAKGETAGDYIKIHPFSYSKENDYFTGGTKTTTFELGDICFGISICYDLRFPEIYQQLSKNADVILVPANWPAKRVMHWNTLLLARAIENQVYIIGINCTGRQGFTKYQGDSNVVNPDGVALLEAADKESLQIIKIEKDTYKYREEFPTKKDRKPDLYKNFY